MTIRGALRWWIRFLWLGLMTVGVVAESWRPHTWLNYYLRIAVLSFLAIGVIGVFAFGFVCPRCRRSLVLHATAIFGGRSYACPKCGVSLDAPAKNNEKLT
jgi:hypothetical protein